MGIFFCQIKAIFSKKLIMSHNLTYFDRIIIASIIGGLLGTLLALVINILGQILFEKQEIYPGSIKDGFLTSVAIGLFAGCFTFSLGSFNIQWVENTDIQSTFILIFATTFFSGAADTLMKIARLAFFSIF